MSTMENNARQIGTASRRLSDEDLRGRTIISAEGQVIGKVAALFFESSSWQVESLEVKLCKEVADQLGVTRQLFRAGSLEIPIGMVQAVGDTVVLGITVEGLRQAAPSANEESPAASLSDQECPETGG